MKPANPDAKKPVKVNSEALNIKSRFRKLENFDIALFNIVASMPGHVYWKDKQGVYLGCNDRQAQSLGFITSDMLVGKTDFDLPWGKGVAKEFRKNDIEVMRSGQTQVIEEPSYMEGKAVTVISQKTPLKDKNGDIVGILGISLDITDRKKMEADLNVAKEAAEVANEAKSEFLRNMEHQLRTPFSGVYSMVEMLAASETDPHKKEMLEVTYQSAKEFLELLNKIIDFARFQIETTEVLSKKFDLKTMIEKAVVTEQAAAVIKHLNLTYDYPDIPTIFISDPYRLQRIILNLLSNAIKFTHQGGVSVRVELGKQIDEKHYIIKLIVTDTGIGIAKEKQQYIYEKFYRAHPANQNKYAGAGLSLHTVKQLVADLEGEIEVKSELEKGTTFTVTIPLQRPLLDELSEDEV